MQPHPAAAAAARVLIERADALASLPAYVRYMRNHGCESRYFKHDPHPAQKPMIEIAERMVLGDLRAATVACPPAYSKTTVMSFWLPTWLLARSQGTCRVLWCSHSASLVNQIAADRREILNSEAWKSLAGCSLRDPGMAADTLVTTNGGGIISRSAGASVTGLRSDFEIGDDLLAGTDEARSPIMLENLAHWLRDDFLTRREGTDSKVLLVGTRWSRRDPIGILMEMTAEGMLPAEHLRIPLICDDEETDPLHRKLGEVVPWDGRFRGDPAFLRQVQRENFSFSCLYQGLPYDASGTFATASDIKIVHEPPVGGTTIMSIDFASTDSSAADASVVSAGVIHRNADGDKVLTVVDVWRGQKTARDVAAAVVAMVKKHKPATIAIEKDGGSKIYASGVLPGEFKNRGVGMPHITWLQVSGASKEQKLSPLRGLIQRGQVNFLAGDWVSMAISEIVNFGASARDDVADSIGGLARIYDRVNVAGIASLAPDAPPQNVYAPIDTPNDATFYAPDGRAYMNTSMGGPGDIFTPRRRLCD